MHGRNRQEYKRLQRDEGLAAKLASKAEQWHALMTDLTQRRHNVDHETETTLKLLEKALLVNPDPLHLWNHRRRILDTQPWKLDTELLLTQAALQNNPKAYGAWFHRKWCLCHGEAPEGEEVSLLDDELQLVGLFLHRDERNFHGWGYRRFIVSCIWNGRRQASGALHDDDLVLGAQVARVCSSNADDTTKLAQLLQTEFNFTTQKVNDNFSNFSAFHYRSKLLPWMLAQQTGSEMLAKDLALVESAIFTEPYDQTAWWYHQFLMDILDDDMKNTVLLQKHLLNLQELAREVPDCKWVLLAILRTLEAIGNSHDDQVRVIQELCVLDVDRKARYDYMLQELDAKGASL